MVISYLPMKTSSLTVCPNQFFSIGQIRLKYLHKSWPPIQKLYFIFLLFEAASFKKNIDSYWLQRLSDFSEQCWEERSNNLGTILAWTRSVTYLHFSFLCSVSRMLWKMLWHSMHTKCINVLECRKIILITKSRLQKALSFWWQGSVLSSRLGNKHSKYANQFFIIEYSISQFPHFSYAHLIS